MGRQLISKYFKQFRIYALLYIICSHFTSEDYFNFVVTPLKYAFITVNYLITIDSYLISGSFTRVKLSFSTLYANKVYDALVQVMKYLKMK